MVVESILEIRWKSEGRRDKGCRYPLYLVFTTKAHARFEGEWFLAFPAGGAGPFGISQNIDQTRVFIPLHAFADKASGTFKVKFYTAGENTIDWFVAALPDYFGGGTERPATVLAAGSAPLKALVESGKPEILVRDAFAPNLATSGAALERPKKTIASNSGEFSLQVFSRFYRVYDTASGELVLERTGKNPNFSPSSRFLGAFADGPGFEIVDLYSGTVIFTSAALNKSSNYEGTAHVAAWSCNDAFVTLSFWGYGGIHVRQSLVDGSGAGDGNPSCHACQGIGVPIFANYDTGMVTWSGSLQKGWASLYDFENGVEASPGSRGTDRFQIHRISTPPQWTGSRRFPTRSPPNTWRLWDRSSSSTAKHFSISCLQLQTTDGMGVLGILAGTCS